MLFAQLHIVEQSSETSLHICTPETDLAASSTAESQLHVSRTSQQVKRSGPDRAEFGVVDGQGRSAPLEG